MGYYGYNISEEELKADIEKERKQKEQEQIETNTEAEEIANEEEYIEVDCSKCSCNPNDCDRDCVNHLPSEYLQEVFGITNEEIEKEVQEELNLYEKKRGFAEKTMDYVFCAEPTLREKMIKELSEENVKYLKTEMRWASLFSIVPFVLGIFLFWIFNKFTTIAIVHSIGNFVTMGVFFSPLLLNNLTRGRVWNYFKKSVNDKKAPRTIASFEEELPLIRDGKLSIPKRKKDFVWYGIIMAFSFVFFIF